MKLSKEEATEELAHQQEMLQLLRRRRRDRGRQATQYGLDAPPHITNEINALIDQICEREAEDRPTGNPGRRRAALVG